MNTGIGDAVNLAWKLAAVLGGRAAAGLLDSYEAERIPFARSLVATTDRIFEAVVGRGCPARLVRTVFAPFVLPLALRFAAVRRAQFRLVSQTRIAYRASPLSDGSAGEVHAGDRLPWVEGADNFAPLASLDWQVHVYGTAAAGLREFAAAREAAAPRMALDARPPGAPGSSGTRCTWCARTATSASPAGRRTSRGCGRTWAGSASSARERGGGEVTTRVLRRITSSAPRRRTTRRRSLTPPIPGCKTGWNRSHPTLTGPSLPMTRCRLGSAARCLLVRRLAAVDIRILSSVPSHLRR